MLAAFNLIRTKLGMAAATSLPQKIGFLDAAIILHALEDTMLRQVRSQAPADSVTLAKLTKLATSPC